MGSVHVEQRVEEAVALVALFKEFGREATFLRCQIQNLAVVVVGIEVHGKHAPNVVATGTQLAANVNDDCLLHKTLVF